MDLSPRESGHGPTVSFSSQPIFCGFDSNGQAQYSVTPRYLRGKQIQRSNNFSGPRDQDQISRPDLGQGSLPQPSSVLGFFKKTAQAVVSPFLSSAAPVRENNTRQVSEKPKRQTDFWFPHQEQKVPGWPRPRNQDENLISLITGGEQINRSVQIEAPSSEDDLNATGVDVMLDQTIVDQTLFDPENLPRSAVVKKLAKEIATDLNKRIESSDERENSYNKRILEKMLQKHRHEVAARVDEHVAQRVRDQEQKLWMKKRESYLLDPPKPYDPNEVLATQLVQDLEDYMRDKSLNSNEIIFMVSLKFRENFFVRQQVDEVLKHFKDLPYFDFKKKDFRFELYRRIIEKVQPHRNMTLSARRADQSISDFYFQSFQMVNFYRRCIPEEEVHQETLIQLLANPRLIGLSDFCIFRDEADRFSIENIYEWPTVRTFLRLVERLLKNKNERLVSFPRSDLSRTARPRGHDFAKAKDQNAKKPSQAKVYIQPRFRSYEHEPVEDFDGAHGFVSDDQRHYGGVLEFGDSFC